jgi:hypothetical protein
MDNKTEKIFWRVGVRDQKRWDFWQWSAEYESLEELMENMLPWIQQNPGRVLQFRKRTAYFSNKGE